MVNRDPNARRSRIGGIIGALIVVWLVIGLIATIQRHYFSSGSANCAKVGTITVTILAGPLNYVGANPKIACPKPSK